MRVWNLRCITFFHHVFLASRHSLLTDTAIQVKACYPLSSQIFLNPRICSLHKEAIWPTCLATNLKHSRMHLTLLNLAKIGVWTTQLSHYFFFVLAALPTTGSRRINFNHQTSISKPPIDVNTFMCWYLQHIPVWTFAFLLAETFQDSQRVFGVTLKRGNKSDYCKGAARTFSQIRTTVLLAINRFLWTVEKSWPGFGLE